jgi:hypothetical protein
VAQDVRTTADRLQFGLISGTFGVVVGALAALIAFALFAWARHPQPFNRWMIGFSGAFFFCVGFVRGSESAESVADAFTATLLIAIGTMGVGGGASSGPALIGGDLKWQSSFWWTVAYFAGMVLLAWLA